MRPPTTPRLLAALGALAVLVAASACSGGHGRPGGSGANTLAHCTPAGTSAANELPDIRLDCLGRGAAVDVADVAGPAVVSLWASWCYPCRQEMPLLQKQSESDDAVQIIGVDTNDKAAKAVEFAQHTVHASYELLSDPTGKLAIALHAPGLPYTVAIGRDGAVLWHKAGKLTGGDIAAAVHRVQSGG